MPCSGSENSLFNVLYFFGPLTLWKLYANFIWLIFGNQNWPCNLISLILPKLAKVVPATIFAVSVFGVTSGENALFKPFVTQTQGVPAGGWLPSQ